MARHPGDAVQQRPEAAKATAWAAFWVKPVSGVPGRPRAKGSSLATLAKVTPVVPLPVSGAVALSRGLPALLAIANAASAAADLQAAKVALALASLGALTSLLLPLAAGFATAASAAPLRFPLGELPAEWVNLQGSQSIGTTTT